MRFKLGVLLLFSYLFSFATHNRAGYISYSYTGIPHKYRIRVYTYTNLSSVNADRCTETVYIDAGINSVRDSVVCRRVNGITGCPSTSISNCVGCTGAERDGVTIVGAYPGYGGVKANVYEGYYTFKGPGHFILTMVDPNRDQGIINFPGQQSDNIAFALKTDIDVSDILGNGLFSTNSSVLVSNPPIQNACIFQPFYYNPGCIDPDGDSLDFKLTYSLRDDPNGATGTVAPIQGEVFPTGLSIDPHTGLLSWLSPQTLGEYNIAMLITEYRTNPVDGQRYSVGTTVFDIQILVVNCPQSDVTITVVPQGGCVIADSTSFNTAFTATITPGKNIAANASGLPFTGTYFSPHAVFTKTLSGSSVSGDFHWAPPCQAVQLNPYYITLDVHDSAAQPSTTDFVTFSVSVISKGPKNLAYTVQSDTVKLTWQVPDNCGNNTKNPIVEYLVYRAAGCLPFTPGPCQTGIPSSSGYTYIGTSIFTKYTDIGLPAGATYSYLVVARFKDGSFSQASKPICVTLNLNIPVITNVSVDTTDAAAGQMFVRWQKPLLKTGTSNSNLDTIQNPGPYHFEVFRKVGAATSYSATPVYVSAAKTYFGQLKNITDTSFTDNFLNTTADQYFYRVKFFAQSHSFASGEASSLFATATGHDKKVVLSWKSSTPWADTLYKIYRQNYTDNGYVLVGSTTLTSDTIYNLSNGHTYCFRILALGTYHNKLIFSPDSNWSQKVCALTVDDAPPCQPQLTVTGDCAGATNKLVWTNPNHLCNINDVVGYDIYYTPTKDSGLSVIYSIHNPNDTTYTTDYSSSIAGCYIVVAIDSAGNKSPLTNENCTDNCPEYELPNIFTPNNDGTNDYYVPVKNKYIRDVAFTLYNRWGEVIYENTDPKLGWDGKSKQMNKAVPDGTYFYTCTVNELHFYGIKTRKLKGFVQLIR